MYPQYSFSVCVVAFEDCVINFTSCHDYIERELANFPITNPCCNLQMDSHLFSSNPQTSSLTTNPFGGHSHHSSRGDWHFRTPELVSNPYKSNAFKFSNPTSNNGTIQMTAPVVSGSFSSALPQSSHNSLFMMESEDDSIGDFQHSSSRDTIINKFRGIPNTYRKPPKRKSEMRSERKKCKVFINEERMADYMRGLNLDNNNLDWAPNLNDYPLHSRTSNDDQSSSEADPNENEITLNDEEWKQLDFSSVLKFKNSSPTPEILPISITNEMQKQNMQVVIWKAPGDCIKEVLRHSNAINTNSKSELNLLSPTNHEPILQTVINPSIWQIPAAENVHEMKNEEESASNPMES